jgi:hypothetical protein
VSSSDFRLSNMVAIMERCLHEAGVFSREIPNRSLVEWTEREERDKSRWAILAAGVSSDDAKHYFNKSPNQADYATIPLQIAGGGQGTILLQIRPIGWPGALPEPTNIIAHYAPGEGVPIVEIQRGRLDFTFDLPDSGLDLFNIRWEIDPRGTGRPPFEDWIKGWYKTIGYNPAHSLSHLHFNSQPKPLDDVRSLEAEDVALRDLRLAAGNANPLAFVLSFAAWVRRNLTVR